MQGDGTLARSIYDTVRFYSLLDMPVTAVQIWRSLVVTKDGSGQRWHGHHVPSLSDINETLNKSDWLQQRVGSQWGYWWLRSAVGKEDEVGSKIESAKIYVRKRLIRHALAQQKWKTARRVGRWLSLVPLVKMIGGSGSLTWFNTEQTSDLDLLVVARAGRIWTARLFLLLVSQLSGRRRKYWDEIAPDKVCLNHYITDESLLMKAEVRNLYMAQQYSWMVPLVGLKVFDNWREANQTWIRQYVMSPARKSIKSRLYIQSWGWWVWVKEWLENLLVEVPGDYMERVVRSVQLWAIEKHNRRRGRGQSRGEYNHIILLNDELAFHPNTKVPGILKKYYEEEGQRTLL